MPDADDEFDAGLVSEETSPIDGESPIEAGGLPNDHDEDQPRDDPSQLDLDQVPEASIDSPSENWTEADEEVAQSEIEEAYQKALAVLEDAGWELDPTDTGASAEGDGPSAPTPNAQERDGLSASEGSGAFQHATSMPIRDAVSAAGPDVGAANSAPSGAGPRLAAGTDRHPSLDELEHSNVSPAQVIESALFVGGTPLTSKKISALLRNSFEAQFIERTIDELNEQYVTEGRPYEIRLGEGGYRLELRPEYEKLRQRAHGSGPREVKLSQDVLEVLALVAYQQPISQEEVESHGKQNAGNLLRQLLRRDLVAIQRGDGGRKDVRYLTTPRFLTVFGIGSLDELPQPEDLARK